MSYSYKCYSDTKEVMKKYVNATEDSIIYGISKTRKEVYNQAKERRPERWTKQTRDWSFSEEEWLNPKQEKETKTEAKAS